MACGDTASSFLDIATHATVTRLEIILHHTSSSNEIASSLCLVEAAVTGRWCNMQPLCTGSGILFSHGLVMMMYMSIIGTTMCRPPMIMLQPLHTVHLDARPWELASGTGAAPEGATDS